MDGALTQAIQRGQWVLLDSANLCNPTVLDRLNPMLEPGGQLYLNECGTVNGQPRVIQPHPNFRLFLALDPRYDRQCCHCSVLWCRQARVLAHMTLCCRLQMEIQGYGCLHHRQVYNSLFPAVQHLNSVLLRS